jgi:SOS-response transcriptional repressor LexA
MTRTKLTRLVTANGKRVALTEKQYQVLKAMRLLPQNPDYQPIVLDGVADDEIAVVAELVEVLE